MHILVYSYFAPRRKHLAGGAQRFLHDLIRGLIVEGEHVTVLSPRPDDEARLLELGPTLSIHPVLNEKENGRLTPYEIYCNAQYYAKLAEQADLVLSIDRAVPVETSTPVVLSLNNFSYSTEVYSVFAFRWDMLIVPSSYLYRCVNSIVGPNFWSEGQRPIHQIPLPVDTNLFRPTDSRALAERLEIPDDRTVVVFPHRPDPHKGLLLALDTVEIVKDSKPDILLLAPYPPNSVPAVRQREEAFIEAVRRQIDARGLRDNIKMHEWIEDNEMPAYLSLADHCLALSHLPEGFGLTALQSIACTTPVISTPAGALTELLPDNHGIEWVPFNSPRAAAAALLKSSDPRTVQKGRRFIQEMYNLPKVVEQYLKCFAGVNKSYASYSPNAEQPDSPSPWCRTVESPDMWHDYEARYLTNKEIQMLEEAAQAKVTDSIKRNFLIESGLITGTVSLEGSE